MARSESGKVSPHCAPLHAGDEQAPYRQATRPPPVSSVVARYFTRPLTGPMGRHILFKCPRTGMKVQHWLEKASPDEREDNYKSVACPACTLTHFIHRETGKLLGEK